jgi:CDP-diacylglycerol--glycerol-3-phosphate 3-phosphatidyltransferase
MTLANQITLFRIALIPVFVVFAIYYGMGVSAGCPKEWMRWAAVGAFVLAAVSDGLDGFVARRLNQRTELGVVLDPLADKGLLLAGIVTLSFSHWTYALPVWFAVLVVARDLIVMAGACVLMLLHGRVAVRPTWSGKGATAFQMLALIAVMLQPEALRGPLQLNGSPLPFVWLDLPVIVAALFTVGSGLGYSARAIAQLHQSGHDDPVEWPAGESSGRASSLARFAPTDAAEAGVESEQGVGGEDSREQAEHPSGGGVK